jgi:hypothetical protein
MNTAEAKQTLGTSGLVLHRAALYDLTLWLLSLGRESAFREKVLRLVMPVIGGASAGCGLRNGYACDRGQKAGRD